MYATQMFRALLRIVVRGLALPDDLVDKVLLAEQLVEHDLHVMDRVPVAVIVETAGAFENAGELLAPRAHEFDVGLRRSVAVIEGALLFGLPPKDFIIAIGIEGRVDVDQIDAAIGELRELVEVVAAVDDARVQKRRRFAARGTHRQKSYPSSAVERIASGVLCVVPRVGSPLDQLFLLFSKTAWKKLLLRRRVNGSPPVVEQRSPDIYMAYPYYLDSAGVASTLEPSQKPTGQETKIPRTAEAATCDGGAPRREGPTGRSGSTANRPRIGRWFYPGPHVLIGDPADRGQRPLSPQPAQHTFRNVGERVTQTAPEGIGAQFRQPPFEGKRIRLRCHRFSAVLSNCASRAAIGQDWQPSRRQPATPS